MLYLPQKWGQQKPPVGTPLNTGHPLTPKVCFWLFNERSGDLTYDLVRGNHGTLVGSPTWGANSINTTSSSGVICDGASGLTSSFTAIFRMRPRYSVSGSFLYIGDGTSDERYVFYYDNNSQIFYLFTPDQSNCWRKQNTGGTLYPANVWMTVAIVVDPGSSPSHLIYFDGAVVTPGTYKAITAQNNLDYIGLGYDPSYQHADADFEYLLVDNRCWSESEIQLLYINPYQIFDHQIWVPVGGGEAPATTAPTGTIYGPLFGPLKGVI
jgi:hypothetical protein